MEDMTDKLVASMGMKQRVLRYLELRHPFLLIGLRKLKGEKCQLLPVEYPVDNKSPRYGYRTPPHARILALVEEGRDRYIARLREFSLTSAKIGSVQKLGNDHNQDPYWLNTWFTGIDAVALCGFLTSLNPRLYVEIGSGFSTRFARYAIRNCQLRTRILSIDPNPRAPLDGLSDEHIPQGLEDVDLGIFDRLSPGDILFFDGSHRSFVNTDATVFFLEVLPRIPSGVVIHIHDIYLPNDYPPGNLYYNEQYLLAVYLMATPSQVLLPNAFVATDPKLAGDVESLWRAANLTGVPPIGCSFWFTVADRQKNL